MKCRIVNMCFYIIYAKNVFIFWQNFIQEFSRIGNFTAYSLTLFRQKNVKCEFGAEHNEDIGDCNVKVRNTRGEFYVETFPPDF